MFSFKITFALALLLGTAFGKGGGFRGGDRPASGGKGPFVGQGGTSAAELICDAAESFPCSTPRVEEGILACRSAKDDEGNLLFEKTVCVDPLDATTAEECGCCGGECVLSCPCTCANEAGYLTEPVRKGPPHAGEDGWMDEMPDDIFKVVVCAEKAKSLSAVNLGRAMCLEECEL